MEPEEMVLRSASVHKRLLQKTCSEALLENEKSVTRWRKYKEDHEALIQNMMLYCEKLSLDIMIPLGTKAFMNGKLRNTNEILISLGDGWFTRMSSSSAVELCTRRINYCNELLEKLKKEQELLESRQTLPHESEMFGDERFPEIIEPYDDEAEKEWRIRHREKECAYRKKLAELKKQARSKLETEEDLLLHLDALDQQEELEEELDRLNEDVESIESSEDISEIADENLVLTRINNEQSESYCRENNETCRVTFNNQNEVRHFEDNEWSVNIIKEEKDDIDESQELIRINFIHSPIKPKIHENLSDEIVSPADFYNRFSYLCNKTPKSILKKSSKDHLCSKTEKDGIKNHIIKDTNNSRSETQSLVHPIGEVVEHKDYVGQTISTRPVSKFRAARMAAKR